MKRIHLPERWLLILLASVQFTHIMDFMIVMPLGPQLMRELSISAAEFSFLIASYTITAGTVGLLAAPFIDRFDRRKVLVFCYAGFILGTLGCGISETNGTLMVARAVCGAFGGISNATLLAIVGDIIPQSRRGAAMGIIMTAFSAAAALGVPFGLFLAQQFRWEAPFFLLVGISLLVEVFLLFALPNIRSHLSDEPPASLKNFGALLATSNSWKGIALMISLVFGHFTIIPFLSPHLVLNMDFPESRLGFVYVLGGVFTVVSAPLIGKLSDRFGRPEVFTVVVCCAAAIILVLTHAGPLPMMLTLLVTSLFFVFASGRYVPAQAVLASAVRSSRRGAFMSLTACTRDFCSGLAAMLAGWMVVATPEGLLNINRLGWLAAAFSFLSIWLIRRVVPVPEQATSPGESELPLGVCLEGNVNPHARKEPSSSIPHKP